MRHTRIPNSVDVLEHLFDADVDAFFDTLDTPIDLAIGSAIHDKLNELHDRLSEHYEHWAPPPLELDEIRLHFDTRELRGHVPHLVPAAALDYRDQTLEQFVDEGDAGITRMTRRRYVAGLLYADRIVEVDPLSIWMYMHGEMHKRDHVCFGFHHLLNVVGGLQKIKPILESGHLVLAPIPSPEETDIDADAARLDAERFGDRAGGCNSEFMWTRLALRVSAKSYASLCPWSYSRWSYVNELLRASLEDMKSIGLDLRVAYALDAAQLPLISDVPIETLLAIRTQEDAFTAWRSELRMVGRLLQEPSNQVSFEREAQSLFRDVIEPKAAAVRQAVSRSSAMSRAVTEDPLQALLGAGLASGLSTASGIPIDGVMISGVAGAVAPILAAGIAPPRPTGAAAILARLI